jgi:hypothetical protein
VTNVAQQPPSMPAFDQVRFHVVGPYGWSFGRLTIWCPNGSPLCDRTDAAMLVVPARSQTNGRVQTMTR